MKKENNYAFIDGQNVHMGTLRLGWVIDYVRFRRYLAEKYSATKVFIFLGYVQELEPMYKRYTNAGFICVFKPTVEKSDGTRKGNCDAELVLQVMIEYSSYDKAIIVSGDGDFFCVVRYLVDQSKLRALLVPNRNYYSSLYKQPIFESFLAFMDVLKQKLEFKRKRP